MADIVAGANGNSQVSVSVSVAGQSMFQKGSETVSYSVSAWGGPKNTIVRRMRSYRDWDNWATSRPNPQAAFEAELNAARTNMLEDQ